MAGDGYNPTYATGADIVAAWDKAANRSSEDPVTKVLNPDIDKTVLEVLTTGDVLMVTFEFSGGNGEIWKDALGGLFKCTVAGTPGTAGGLAGERNGF